MFAILNYCPGRVGWFIVLFCFVLCAADREAAERIRLVHDVRGGGAGAVDGAKARGKAHPADRYDTINSTDITLAPTLVLVLVGILVLVLVLALILVRVLILVVILVRYCSDTGFDTGTGIIRV